MATFSAALRPSCIAKFYASPTLHHQGPSKVYVAAPARLNLNVGHQRAHVLVQAQARRARDDEWVSLDGEDEWEEQGGAGGGSSLSGPIIKQSFRAVSMVVDRLTDITLQLAPEEASPTAVRAAVTGGLVLVTVSFVKGILSFFLTIGTVVFGAFVAVRVFGLDVTGSVDSGRRSGKKNRNASQSRRALPSSRRQYDDSDGDEGGSGRGGVVGLLSDVLNVVSVRTNGGDDSDDDDDGLSDVRWFDASEKRGKKKSSPKRR